MDFSVDLWQLATVFLRLRLVNLVSLHGVFVSRKITSAKKWLIHTDKLPFLEIDILLLKYPLFILKLYRIIFSISEDAVHLKLFGIGRFLDLDKRRINVLHLFCFSQFLLVVLIFVFEVLLVLNVIVKLFLVVFEACEHFVDISPTYLDDPCLTRMHSYRIFASFLL